MYIFHCFLSFFILLYLFVKNMKFQIYFFLIINIDVSSNRFHLPSHEAIIHELEENDYDESVRYLKELFELDEETRKEAGPGTLTWKKPRLKDNKDAMKRLKEGLIAFEQAKNAGV